MIKLVAPFNFIPRDYQRPLWRYICQDKENPEARGKRAVAVFHRRAGKDITCFNIMVTQSFKRKGVYYYFFPTYKQGKKVIWEGITGEGQKIIDTFAPEKLFTRDNSELKLTNKVNGSIIRIVGTDDFDSIRGTNPVGTVWSEYSFQNPQAWATMRPILDENGGWAIFNYTPNGENHGKTLYDNALDRENWYCEKLTVLNSGIYKPEQLADILRECIDDYGEIQGTAIYEREYLCSFSAPVMGAYYGEQLERAEKENRITNVPHEVNAKVCTYWDIGVGDSTAIWFVQFIGQEIRLIDYYENSSFGLDHYIKVLQNKPYIYDEHYAPHDMKVREFGSGQSRIDTARALGVNFKIAPKMRLEDGIDAVRRMLGQCWFDKTKCEYGINALKNYHRKYNEDSKTYSEHPDHDWSSHCADAFRYLAVSRKQKKTEGLVYQDAAPADMMLGINSYRSYPTDDVPSYAQF